MIICTNGPIIRSSSNNGVHYPLYESGISADLCVDLSNDGVVAQGRVVSCVITAEGYSIEEIVIGEC